MIGDVTDILMQFYHLSNFHVDDYLLALLMVFCLSARLWVYCVSAPHQMRVNRMEIMSGKCTILRLQQTV